MSKSKRGIGVVVTSICEFLGGEHALAVAAFPGGDEIPDDVFGFAQHLEVRRLVEMRARRGVRPADHDRLVVLMAQLNQAEAVRLLVEHAAGHHHVGPGEVRHFKLFGVAVDELEFPVLRQQRRDRDQTERRGRIARADELARFRVAPERVRHEFRVNEQNAGRTLFIPREPLFEAHPYNSIGITKKPLQFGHFGMCLLNETGFSVEHLRFRVDASKR